MAFTWHSADGSKAEIIQKLYNVLSEYGLAVSENHCVYMPSEDIDDCGLQMSMSIPTVVEDDAQIVFYNLYRSTFNGKIMSQFCCEKNLFIDGIEEYVRKFIECQLSKVKQYEKQKLIEEIRNEGK